MDTLNEAREERRWSRRPANRWISGVASGIADKAVVPVWVVRIAFVMATPIGGLGPIAYLFLWWLMPRTDLPESAAQRMAGRFPQAPVWLGVGLVGVGGLLFAGQLGWLSPIVVVALALVALGVLVFLREPDRARQDSAEVGEADLSSPLPLSDEPVHEADLPPASLPVAARQRGRPRRTPSFLGPLALGIGLMLVGAGALLDLAGAISFSVAQAAALLLLILGAGMAVGGFIGRARWLIVPVFLVAPLALVLTVLHINLDDGFGNRTVTVRTLQTPVDARLAAGDMTIDMMHLRPGESGTVRVHVGVGKLTLNIPDDVTVVLTGSVGFGSTENLYSHIRASGVHACCRSTAEPRWGFAQPLRWAATPRAGTTAGIVRVDATVSIGAIRINHVDRGKVTR
jgi:phage shock protein PspC (stress-responsive transcriptional regulator)